ncbi:MAG: T9SS type A sorting domain-containing protein [Cryomorphaceae bacterium]
MKKNLLLTLGLFACLSSFSQYTLTAFNEPYEPISNGTTPAGVFEGWDDPEFSVPLGFDFTMGNNTFNALAQGGLGAIFIGGNFNNGSGVGFLSDIIDGGQLPEELPSEISYVVTGNPGNQICKIEYTDAAFYAEVVDLETATNRTNFQIWIYESDLSIEIRFGESTITNAQVAYEGLDGPSIGVFLGISDDGETLEYGGLITGDPASPELQTVNIVDEGFFTGLDGTPADGQVYRLTPSVVSVKEQTETAFAVFPNPAIDKIQVDGNIRQNAVYRISDITGKIVLSGNYNSSSTIDLSALSPGVYVIGLDGYSSVAKFVKN